MLKPFGFSIFFYRTKTILSTKNIRKYTHEYATSISQNTHICCAKYSHSNTKYIATNLQQHNIQKTKTILLQCKNPLFARQKTYFCSAKTILLHSEYVTYTEWTRCEHSAKYQRTPQKHPTNTPQNVHIHPRNVQRNTPSGVGSDSSRPYPNIIKYTYPFHQIRVFTLSNMRFRSPFRGYIHIRGRDKSAPTAANRLPIMLRTDCNNVANIPQNTHEIFRKMSTFTHETPTNHSVRRRGRFIAPVSLHYQIYIFVSPNTHFHFIIHEYSHYQICVSILHFVGVYIYAGTINR